jgi:hypothetical protein
MTKHAATGEPTRPDDQLRRDRWAMTRLAEALQGLQYGQVTVIVQDGAVVQVERTERHRFQRSEGRGQKSEALTSDL